MQHKFDGPFSKVIGFVLFFFSHIINNRWHNGSMQASVFPAARTFS